MLTVTAADQAGNTAKGSVTFTTTTSIASLEKLVQLFQSKGMIKDEGVANSLLRKVRNGELMKFIEEVSSQAGKHITKEAAAILIRDAKYLLK
ncbi:hypothetical protein ACP26L_10845 [Paenibacillus sp. S-38]|uniref:hypothetical protein n=1 Tax=Paenibacillus sp. S-38 TaxID=3416710 RepID=UPI003CF123DD